VRQNRCGDAVAGYSGGSREGDRERGSERKRVGRVEGKQREREKNRGK